MHSSLFPLKKLAECCVGSGYGGGRQAGAGVRVIFSIKTGLPIYPNYCVYGRH